MQRTFTFIFVAACMLLPSLAVHPAPHRAAQTTATGESRLAAAGMEVICRQYAEAVLHAPGSGDTLLADFVRTVPRETKISDQMVQELQRLYPLRRSDINACLKRQNADGSWPDINYADTRRSGWEPRLHAERALMLARAYNMRGSDCYHSPAVLDAYRRAVNWWADSGPKCRNWWYNEIGMPKTFGDSYMLMRSQLQPGDLSRAVKVLSAARIGRTGQNRVWLAGIVLVRALLEGDAGAAWQARNAILDQVVLGQKEGIQPDWSFHQHGPQQQFGNYGLAFISDMSFYARVLRGTPMALSDTQLGILSGLMNEGYRWIVWHRQMDVGAIGRQFFHNAQQDKAYSVAFAAQNLGLGQFPREGNDLVGHRHFASSCYTIHRRPTWMASLKMASDSVIGTELVNEDNLLGFYLADGATYYYVRGDEYADVFPLWNWHLVPGTTTPVYDGARMPDAVHDDARNHTGRVWGLTDGGCGMSAMELNRLGTHARKAWIFADGYVLCLGAGIRSDSVPDLVTCVDQRTARGTLWHKRRSGALLLHHDRTGYIIMDNAGPAQVSDGARARVEAAVERRRGDWARHMGGYGKYPAQGKVMQIAIRHDGTRRQPGAYAYVVMPDCTRRDVRSFDPAAEIEILRNDERAQIVRLAAVPGKVWVAAYEPGTYDVGGESIAIDKPGVYVKPLPLAASRL